MTIHVRFQESWCNQVHVDEGYEQGQGKARMSLECADFERHRKMWVSGIRETGTDGGSEFFTPLVGPSIPRG